MAAKHIRRSIIPQQTKLSRFSVHLEISMALAGKKDVSVLRIAASLWLEQNPGHPQEEHVRRALENTNVPKLNGRPKIPEELRVQVIQLKKAGSSDVAIGARLGISRTAVARIWKGLAPGA